MRGVGWILNQNAGDIEDEFDTAEDNNIKQHDEQRFVVKALTPIEEFNRHFKCNLDDDEFDTVGGIVMGALGHLPKRGETVTIEHYQFRVLNADKRRILLLETLVLDTQED